jgi:two-component system OmpR family response regulator
MRVLIIEDDQKISELLERGFKDAGFKTDVVNDGLEGYTVWKNNKFDAVIIDLMLPNMDGLTIIEKVRELGINTPVIILSAKQSIDDRIKGLKSGSDDYMTKPFSFSELLARVNAHIRRVQQDYETASQKELQIEDLKINLEKRKAYRGDEVIELQPKEFALLELLMKNANNIVDKNTILREVYDYNFDPQTNIVDVLVCRLRNKIDKEYNKKNLQTVRGLGYVLRGN